MYHDMKSLNELQDQFEKLGPLLFGFHDGQSEAPKIMSQRVKGTNFYLCIYLQMYLLLFVFLDKRLLLGPIPRSKQPKGTGRCHI